MTILWGGVSLLNAIRQQRADVHVVSVWGSLVGRQDMIGTASSWLWVAQFRPASWKASWRSLPGQLALQLRTFSVPASRGAPCDTFSPWRPISSIQYQASAVAHSPFTTHYQAAKKVANGTACHSERSEESRYTPNETLRFAEGDSKRAFLAACYSPFTNSSSLIRRAQGFRAAPHPSSLIFVT